MVLSANLNPLFPTVFAPATGQVIAAAHVVGLTQNYKMFAVVGRTGTDLSIQGTTLEGAIEDLTEQVLFRPGFWDRNFFDHKHGKLIHNLVFFPDTRLTFIEYLCRRSKDQLGRTFGEITLIGSGEALLKNKEPDPLGDRKVSLYLNRKCAEAAP